MSDILAALAAGGFVPFVQLFRRAEGRMGVTVTFVAILELMREGLIDIVQAQPYAPLHVRATAPSPLLHVVAASPAAGDQADEDPS
jgi:segregation and condensation protein A